VGKGSGAVKKAVIAAKKRRRAALWNSTASLLLLSSGLTGIEASGIQTFSQQVAINTIVR
jgi:hypothetical protein